MTFYGGFLSKQRVPHEIKIQSCEKSNTEQNFQVGFEEDIQNTKWEISVQHVCISSRSEDRHE